MKAFEAPFDVRLPPGLPVVLRIDGNSFHVLSERLKFGRPYDQRIHEAMTRTARHIVDYFDGAALAYWQSDEINVLLRPVRKGAPFLGNRIQKLVSLAAARATYAFARALDAAGFPETSFEFDARVFVLPADRVVDYFVWRQDDAFKNCVNAQLFWALVDEWGDAPGSRAKAHAFAKGKSLSEQQEVLFQRFAKNIMDVESHWRLGAAWHRGPEGWLLNEALNRWSQSSALVVDALG